MNESQPRDWLDATAPERPGEALDRERLATYLAARFPDEPRELTVEQFPAGHSNLTYGVRYGALDLVLRRPPFGSHVKTAHDMGREFRVLSKLCRALPAAPAPVCYCDREDVLGAPFYLMRRIRGVILRHDLPEGMTLSKDDVRRLHLNFVAALAELHAVDFTAIGLGDLGKPVGYVARQVTGWIERYRGSQTDEIPEFDALAAWLPAHRPAESGAALVHNDFKFDNLVLAPDDVTRVVGVLDWEMSTLGDPLMDLGTALCYWIEADDPTDLRALQWGPTALPGGLSRRALAEQYAQRTGRDIRSLDFYYVFGLLKTAVIAQQIYYRFQQGKTHDARFARFLEATRTMLRAAARAAETGRV